MYGIPIYIIAICHRYFTQCRGLSVHAKQVKSTTDLSFYVITNKIVKTNRNITK